MAVILVNTIWMIIAVACRKVDLSNTIHFMLIRLARRDKKKENNKRLNQIELNE